MRGCVVPLFSTVLMLGACSAGGEATNLSGNSISEGGGAATAVSTVLGSSLNQDIPVQSQSASFDSATNLVQTYMQDFTLRSREETNSGEAFRRIRYGKPRRSFHSKRNYTVPLSVTISGGQSIGTGTATFSGDAVESGVASRTINLTDVSQNASVFGVFTTDDTGISPRQDFFEIHSYAAGIPTNDVPLIANYTGTFVANVISDGSGTATAINLPADVSINLLGDIVSGTFGAISAPDITINGTVVGTTISGTATVSSNSVVLGNGVTGTFTGGLFGDNASEIAGTVGISDKSGTINHELVGAFGGIKN